MSILSELSERVPGRVFGPGTPEYDAGSAVFLGPGAPEAVARPESADEVAAVVAFAAEARTPLAIRSGGHGGLPAEGGVVLDLSCLASISSDGNGRVHVGAGARWGDVAAALAPAGRGVSSGDTRDVGVGGLATGGGIGWLVRTHGLTVDAVREIEVVTAAGAVLTVSDDSHPDLFWALRGGGGNFGVATRFTFETAPVAGLVGGSIRFEQSGLGDVLRAWRDITVASPDTLNSSLMVMPAFAPGVPAGPTLGVALLGTEAELRAILAPLLDLPSVAEEQLGPVAYGDLLESAPPGRPPFRFVGGNGFVPALTDEFLASVERAVSTEVPTMALLRALGGAYRRVDADATPLAFRDAEALLVLNAILPADAPDEQAAEVQLALDAPLDFTVGRYGNFTQEYGDDVVATIYPPATLDRLRRVKAEFDPGDVFRAPHHVAPLD
ncbi:FAD-binding oxidoreductase [Agromyces sp. MMS24-K17]|uniref:FAD-binding oxidoreductase n=1 Tax=Agromyces sp. MMS24-K17 TaxID=3372850 RepID=UPI003754E772